MNFIYENERIFLEDENGRLQAELLYSNISDGAVNITSTFVDDSLRGKGIASELLKAAAEKFKAENKKVYPACSYAIKWFREHEEYSDIYFDVME